MLAYTRNENLQGRAQPAQFFTFSPFVVATRERRVALTSVFFQGPIGLDGPKGDPVSSA